MTFPNVNWQHFFIYRNPNITVMKVGNAKFRFITLSVLLLYIKHRLITLLG